jgi:hypothetical protein
MAYWNGHAFQWHANEIPTGAFDSPVSGDRCVLSWSERNIAEAMLRRYFADETIPWGDHIGFSIARTQVELFVGKRISPNLWAVAMTNLELAGVFEVIRERGQAHKITLGRLLRCDLNGCRIKEHYPGGYPLPEVSTPIPEVRREVSLGEETAQVSLHKKNLNNPLITLNTGLEVSAVRDSEVSPGNQTSSNPDEWRELLPRYWQEWLELRARLKEFDIPSGMDIGHAQDTYERTGLDLEANGNWRDGRARPIPATN